MNRSLVALLMVALAGSAACGGPSPSVSSGYSVEVANGTTLAVTLVVNGRVIEVFPPGGGTSSSGPIGAGRLGPLPWVVEARSPSGRLLTSMTVHEGDVFATSLPGGGGSARGDGARVDLSCGRLDIWSGPPMIGPAPGSGAPGDCAL